MAEPFSRSVVTRANDRNPERMDVDKISGLKITHKDRVRPARGRIGAYAGGLLLIVVALAGAFVLHGQGFLTRATSVELVTVNPVYPSQVVTEFNASGYVVAQRRAAVASKGTGRLDQLTVREGSRVKEGDVLARLENDDLRAEKEQVLSQIAAARAELARAETDLGMAQRQHTRLKHLWDQRVAAKVDFENARDQHQRARAAVESAKGNIRALEAGLKRAQILIEYTVIRAPFDGVVLTKDADVGEVVAPFGSSLNAKAAVVTMADMSSLMVQVDVSESSLPRVREGQPCEIQLDALPEARLYGSVRTVVPTADRTRGTVLVKIQFDHLDPRVLPEMSARVSFLSRRLEDHELRPFLGVHRDALTQRDQGMGMFRVEETQARWAPLAQVNVMGDYVRLEAPWKAGDRIVRKPPPTLRDGARVSLPD
jgi:RND family efflux transporter MFP subunit